MQAFYAYVADIHGRTLAHGLQPLEHLNVAGAVFLRLRSINFEFFFRHKLFYKSILFKVLSLPPIYHGEASANRLLRYKGSNLIAKKQYFPCRFHIRKFAKIYKKNGPAAHQKKYNSAVYRDYPFRYTAVEKISTDIKPLTTPPCLRIRRAALRQHSSPTREGTC